MSRFCSHCGEQVRGDDRFCVRCGNEVNAGVEPTEPGFTFRAPDHPRRRAGGFIVRHARGLMALAAVAALVAIGALSAASSDTNPGPDDTAPASEVSAERNRQQSERTNDSAATKPSQDRVVTARGADGRTYRCGLAVLDRVTAAKDRVTRREKVLKARRAAVRRLEAQYPAAEAPADVVDRYEELLARANAQVTWTNTAIAQYNRILRDVCDPS
jgi:hypothetical protein